MSLMDLVVERIMSWMFRARLNLVFVFGIKEIALEESLRMRTLSLLVASAYNMASEIAKVSAVNMLEKGASLKSV